MRLARRIGSRYRTIVAAVIVASLVLFVPPAVPAHAQLQLLFGINEQQEIQLGRQIEAQVEKQYGFDDNPDWNARVTNIGLRVAEVSERQYLPWTYHIVRDRSVNAFAVLGGFIFVTRGLMREVPSDDELAFVLGHETTHVAHRHAVDLAQRDMEMQGAAILLTQLVFGGSAVAYQLTQLTRGLMDAKYSRDKEYEADHYGVIFAQRAGFDPIVAIAFFERLQDLEKQQNAVGTAFASHPPTSDRIKAVRTELRQMGYEVAGPPEPPVASPPPAPPAAEPTSPADPTTPVPGQWHPHR